MRKLAIISLSIFSIAVAKEVKLETPPENIGKYYPPKSEKFEFLNTMYAMSTAFTGLMTNVQEKDWKNAEKWVKILEENYIKVGKLVPEFDKGLRKNEMTALVNAVKSKDMQGIQENAQAVGKSCSQCHQKYMLTTKIIYHYPSWSMINIDDPITRTALETEDYMKKMTDSMKKLRVYVDDNKQEKAVVEANNFAKRLKALSQSCSECHTNKLSEQIYFGKDMDEKLNALINAVKSNNKQEINKNLNWISVNNCSKCHNTHQTTAIMKDILTKP